MKNNIVIAILAAGKSERMGEPKLLKPLQGSTLLTHTISQCQNIEGSLLVVITGAYDQQMKPIIEAKSVNSIFNPDWHLGMASSIITAVKYAVKKQTRGIVLTVADQKYLQKQIILQFFDNQRIKRKKIVASKYDDGYGTPVYFDRQYFGDLSKIKGDQGAKQIIKDHQDIVEYIEFPKGNIDLDTPEDWNRYVNL